MFVLNSNIRIGIYKMVKVNEVKVTKSMFEFIDKAVIKIPATGRLQLDKYYTKTAETPKLFAEGNKVVIDLGYSGTLKNEFTGFVSRVNLTTPVEIKCEGYSYQLRQQSYLKTFVKTTLKAVLQFLIAGTDITLDSRIPDLKIDKWVCNQESGTEVLAKLKKELLVNIFFTGTRLYAGLAYLNYKADVKYKLGWNVIKDNELKLHEAKNREVVVKFIGEKKDGTKTKVQHGTHTRTVDKRILTSGSSGTSGETVVHKTHSVTDERTLSAMAEKKHRELTYDGYEGKITAFIAPYCEPGYRAVLTDPKYPERSGNYIVESTEVTFGRSGARRKVGIGAKL